MVRIRHTRGKKAPSVEAFSRAVVRFGAAPASDVVFYGEGASVAASHAELRLEGATWVLVDLGGVGTYVRGASVARRALSSGDVVELGGPGGPAFTVELEARSTTPQPLGVVDDGKVDLATARELVRAAVERASAPDGKMASIVATKVAEAQRRAGRRNLLLGAGVVGALAIAAFTGKVIWGANQKADAIVSEAGLDRRRAEVPVEPPPPPGELPTRVLTGRQIYEENKAALYVLGYTNGRIVGAFCTAFAIAPDLLATNAHCVLTARSKSSYPLIATQNDSGGKVKLSVLSTSYHPGYKPGSRAADSPDVGLVRVKGVMPKVVTIASDAELRALGAGDDAFVLGFPGRVMDPISPSATFLSGHVNRVTGFDGGATTGDRAVLVQHDAVTRGGNSGSPIFNQYGHVVALHAAHLDDEEEQQVNGAKQMVLDASPYRVGMRVDLLRGVQRP
jgi:CBS domain-containing protein